MKNQAIQQVFAYGESELKIETNGLAARADAAVTVTWGETVVLATVVVADEPREGVDFLPLLIDYEERLYAAGKISGSRFIKREGRPSDQAILSARLIDRPLRPLFPKYFRNDIQVVITVLSFDGKHDPAVISIIAASTALMLSPAPFQGPVAAVRIGLIGETFKINPTDDELKKSQLDLVVAATKEKIMMIDAAGNEVSEEKVKEALKMAQKAVLPALEKQEEMARGITKLQPIDPAKDLLQEVDKLIGAELTDLLKNQPTDSQDERLSELEKRVLESFEGDYKQVELKDAVDKLMQKKVRARILENEERPDGRKLDEIRPLDIRVGLLPRTHGSALFARGKTQSLTIATLGAPGDEQFIDTMEEEGTKRYMHHYNFPPFSTGEVSPLRGASRREIGHGALAEKALLPMIPDKEDFPYTIRLVSEILSSNGSSSMAATCGSTLALMDAGVPIKAPVAGIAIGLVTKDGFNQLSPAEIKTSDYRILTDIQGIEDFGGDMDFKVAGTQTGITAIQMDTKLAGITWEIASQALGAARRARSEILKAMSEVIDQPRKQLSRYAPRIEKVMINPKKIGDVIGPGGKTIRKIIESCGGDEKLSIDLEDTGLVLISSTDQAAGEKARQIIQDLTYEIKLGETLTGQVVEIIKDRNSGKEIGALVEIKPGKVGMVHISEISKRHIPSVSSVLKIGQKVTVKVIRVDEEHGRFGLSIKRVQERD